MNTLEGNKLIAEFDDCISIKPKEKIYKYEIDGDSWALDGLKYHSSWDWLRPVIDKIFTYSIAHPEEAGKVCNMKIIVNIDAAWERVAQFIQWYNDNQIKRK